MKPANTPPHPDSYRPETPPAGPPGRPRVLRLDAACVADAASEHRPGSLLLRLDSAGLALLAAGTPVDLAARPDLPPPDEVIARPGATLIPVLVNAHTHLDLTHMGPIAHDPAAGLTPWLKTILAGRVHDPDEIAASTRLGIAKSLAGGVAAVGDIAGWTNHGPTLVPWHTLADSPLLGISYVEFFAIGAREHAALARMDTFLRAHERDFARQSPASARLGLTPHAPYSVSLAAYAWTVEHARVPAPPGPIDIPLTTHLAESLAEREFIASATGPKRDLLELMHLWEDRVAAELGAGRHPIEHLAGPLAAAPWLVAHVNDATDETIALLARTNTSVAYCPRSSAYFGTDLEFGPHRYRDMLAAGVNVCLGTDSIVNLDTPDRISTLDEMRLLVARDGLDPRLALEMGTTRGARALAIDPALFTFTPGPLAGVVRVDDADSLAAALATDHPFAPELIGPLPLPAGERAG